MAPERGESRPRPLPRAGAIAGQVLAACLAVLPAPAMPASPAPACHLDWQARHFGDRLEIAPVITCDQPCRLRFLLATVDAPSQALRQSGSLQLAAATPRQLGRMSLSPAGPACRIQLTLWHEDGREERFATDACASGNAAS